MNENKNETTIDDLARMVANGFSHMNERFEKTDEQFEKIDERFEKIDEQLNKIKREVTALRDDVTDRFRVIDTHLNIDSRFPVQK